ncbi:hypothetical protein KQX54_014871 [Cotesia glomerata]|uniref:Uncharacterized protein n=1 Tax=Cotesia glomerata TaxID=32391 RepID=A0AAV7I9H4_COTGL|nr:hypothetical protein KQX54_014871 [Cotesia glomerata]
MSYLPFDLLDHLDHKSSSVMLTERSVKILETNYLYESSKSCRNIPLNSGNLEGHISALIAKLKGNHGKKEKVSEKDSKSEVISEVDDNGLENGRNGKEINFQGDREKTEEPSAEIIIDNYEDKGSSDNEKEDDKTEDEEEHDQIKDNVTKNQNKCRLLRYPAGSESDELSE